MCTRSQLAFANAIEPGSRRAGFHLCSALAAISEYCGRTGQNPNACLASALSQERNHYTPAYPRPRRQALWNGAAPGHAAAPLGPLQTCSSGTLATRTAPHLLMLGKTAAACHFVLAWSRTGPSVLLRSPPRPSNCFKQLAHSAHGTGLKRSRLHIVQIGTRVLTN
jgi:hypothetical protein